MNPFYDHGGITIFHGDCRDILPKLGGALADMVLTDPPYGETSLEWDVRVPGWQKVASAALKDTGSLWCFGSFRFFLAESDEFEDFEHVQEIIWEKHNGSGFINDRFKRVHELAVQYRKKGAKWADDFKEPQFTNDATARTLRRKSKPTHMNGIESQSYQSEDGGPRLMRSVIKVRSCHGYADHPTQKPIDILTPLINYSTRKGDLIIDLFGGSFSTLVAAKATGRRAIGFDINERFCEIGAKRLSQEVFDL